MNRDELKQILADHRDWLNSQGGSRAVLSHADLRGADLHDADLHDAVLRGADLHDAVLSDAVLSHADLRGADLRGAVLRGADLHDAVLRGADLRGADLRRAESISPLAAARLSVCPPEGAFIAWKACRNAIVKLEIPADAKRSNATSRKCRASHVLVLEVIGEDDYGVGRHDANTVYRKGETVTCHEWDPDRWNECSGGIHFFMTREEAEDWR